MKLIKMTFFCPDKNSIKKWEKYLKIRKRWFINRSRNSNYSPKCPVGLGEPVFDKVDALIAQGIMSIPAVKGVEIGKGFECAELQGEENADEIEIKKNKVNFLSNNSGGTLGGITSGQDIVVRFAVKPTSSILIEKNTINKQGKNTKN